MSEIGYFVAKIRHEFTRYDKLCAFYSVQPYARKRLNRTIGNLINEKITIDEFHKIIRDIEAEVDLTRKDNQRRYLKQRSRMYRENGWPANRAKQLAKTNLQAVMKFQQAQVDGKFIPDFWQQFTISGYQPRK